MISEGEHERFLSFNPARSDHLNKTPSHQSNRDDNFLSFQTANSNILSTNPKAQGGVQSPVDEFKSLPEAGI